MSAAVAQAKRWYRQRISAMVLAGPRVYFAMARDRVFLAAASRVHPRHKTPVLAIAALGFASDRVLPWAVSRYWRVADPDLLTPVATAEPIPLVASAV